MQPATLLSIVASAKIICASDPQLSIDTNDSNTIDANKVESRSFNIWCDDEDEE